VSDRFKDVLSYIEYNAVAISLILIIAVGVLMRNFKDTKHWIERLFIFLSSFGLGLLTLLLVPEITDFGPYTSAAIAVLSTQVSQITLRAVLVTARTVEENTPSMVMEIHYALLERIRGRDRGDDSQELD
jgi:hypothetical protein